MFVSNFILLNKSKKANPAHQVRTYTQELIFLGGLLS